MNKLTIIVTERDKSTELSANMIERGKNKTCYVCISRPHEEIKKFLESKGVDCTKVIFIDTVSRPDNPSSWLENCYFSSRTQNLCNLQKEIDKVLIDNPSDSIIFDSITDFLKIHDKHAILKFTHELVIDYLKRDLIKTYLVHEQKETDNLVEDLSYFADKTIKR